MIKNKINQWNTFKKDYPQLSIIFIALIIGVLISLLNTNSALVILSILVVYFGLKNSKKKNEEWINLG